MPECYNSADVFGDHQIGCGGNGDRSAYHNAIRDVIFSAAKSAALAPTKEALGVVPSSSSHPTVMHPPPQLELWLPGCTRYPHDQTPITADPWRSGSLRATPWTHLKLAAHLLACQSSGTDFVPVMAETLDGLAVDFIKTITSVSRAIVDALDPQSLPLPHHIFLAGLP